MSKHQTPDASHGRLLWGLVAIALAAALMASARYSTVVRVKSPFVQQHASIIVAVTSKAENAQRRSWLRKQFSRSVALLRAEDARAAGGSVLKFVVGRRNVSADMLSSLQEEQQQHGDLLVLDVIDSNHPDPPVRRGDDTATALKVVYSAAWATRHFTFDWFARLGDDSFFRVDEFLARVARALPQQRLIYCYAEDPGLHVRFAEQGIHLTRYCSGMGYLMTHDAAEYIASNAHALSKGYPEDAVAGLWFAGTRFKIQHDGWRFTDWVWRRCSNDTLIVHKHDFGRVDDDGVMRSCFPANTTVG